MIRLVEFELEGRKPFQRWFQRLDAGAAARVTVGLVRLGRGLTSQVRSCGQGVSEYRIHTGPGYRVYFAWLATGTILLLAGGTKRTQRRDIAIAQQRWQRYRQIGGMNKPWH